MLTNAANANFVFRYKAEGKYYNFHEQTDVNDCLSETETCYSFDLTNYTPDNKGICYYSNKLNDQYYWSSVSEFFIYNNFFKPSGPAGAESYVQNVNGTDFLIVKGGGITFVSFSNCTSPFTESNLYERMQVFN